MFFCCLPIDEIQPVRGSKTSWPALQDGGCQASNLAPAAGGMWSHCCTAACVHRSGSGLCLHMQPWRRLLYIWLCRGLPLANIVGCHAPKLATDLVVIRCSTAHLPDARPA